MPPTSNGDGFLPAYSAFQNHELAFGHRLRPPSLPWRAEEGTVLSKEGSAMGLLFFNFSLSIRTYICHQKTAESTIAEHPLPVN